MILTAVAAVVRFAGIGKYSDGGTPLFDGKYYAIQAAEVLRNGGVEDNQGFGVVVHPPFGKQLIALGEWLVGYNPTGWRLASAVAGMVSVLLIIRVTRRMTRSTLLGGIAGVLLICDGVSHVMARIGPAGRVRGSVRAGRVRVHHRRPGPGQGAAGGGARRRFAARTTGPASRWVLAGGGSPPACSSG